MGRSPLCTRSQNRRPDEEGIKTGHQDGGFAVPIVRTVDLMKKGLRLPEGVQHTQPTSQNRRPDEEGIKTSTTCALRQYCRQNRRPDEEGIKTVDASNLPSGSRQNRRPDEEGIKTLLLFLPTHHFRQNRRPDEEGIKTMKKMNYLLLTLSQNRRPDEEGIKTIRSSFPNACANVRTVDLMKKGLRPVARLR